MYYIGINRIDLVQTVSNTVVTKMLVCAVKSWVRVYPEYNLWTYLKPSKIGEMPINTRLFTFYRIN